MNKRDAKRLGRWCERHDQVHRRVPLENGEGWATGCPDCLNEPELREALAALVAGAFKMAEAQHD